jgi:hypothetical protein
MKNAMQDNPQALYIWHWKVSSIASWVLYRTRQAENAGRDWTTALTALRQNEATLIAVDERIFIFNLLGSKPDHFSRSVRSAFGSEPSQTAFPHQFF